jgi:hypothetical protein
MSSKVKKIKYYYEMQHNKEKKVYKNKAIQQSKNMKKK